ncbi:hypothetical protein D3C81_1462790 [compost metagenome]
MVCRGRLGVPDIAGIAGQLPGLQSAHHGIALHQLAAGAIYKVRTLFHPREHGIVKQTLGRRIEGNLQVDDISRGHQCFYVRMIVKPQFFLYFGGESVTLGVLQVQVERLQSAKHGQTNTARADGAEMHAFDVIAPIHTISDIPAAFGGYRMCGQVTADQHKYQHHYVFGNADAIGARDFRHRNVRAAAAAKSTT